MVLHAMLTEGSVGAGTTVWAKCSRGVRGIGITDDPKKVTCEECLQMLEWEADMPYREALKVMNEPRVYNMTFTNPVTTPEDSVLRSLIKGVVKEVLYEEDRQQWHGVPTGARGYQKAHTAKHIIDNFHMFKGLKIRTYSGQRRSGVLTDVEHHPDEFKSCHFVLDGQIRYYTAMRTFVLDES